MDFKPQDLIFVILLVALILKREPKLLVWAGLISLVVSIPLFSQWIFFTAQRLTWYAAAFFLSAALLYLKTIRHN